MMSNRKVDQLAQLLETERAALLSGNLEALGELAVEKEEIAAKFDRSNANELRMLSVALSRNASLLAAAQKGVNTVVKTLNTQRASRNSLSSYDSKGNATEITQPTRGTERRF